MLVVLGEVVDDAGGAGVQVSPAELLGADDLAGRRLHQRGAAEEDRALLAHDHRLVAHRRHVGAAGGAGAEHGGDLRDAGGRHRGLVEEDAAEVLAVGEDLVLLWQEGAAGVDQVDAGQPVVQRHLLRAQVLLDRQRVVGPALDRGIVGHDHDLASLDATDAGDDAGAGGVAVVEVLRRQRRQLQQRRARVAEPVHPLARQQLAACDVALACPLSPARRGALETLAQLGGETAVLGLVGLELGGVGAGVGGQRGHAASTAIRGCP